MLQLIYKRSQSMKSDVLSGLTVALALVPEAVAFAFVAGVEPLVGLYAAFMVGLITATIGGRAGGISAHASSETRCSHCDSGPGKFGFDVCYHCYYSFGCVVASSLFRQISS